MQESTLEHAKKSLVSEDGFNLSLVDLGVPKEGKGTLFLILLRIIL